MTITHHKRILHVLSDRKWHCSTEIEYCRDARKRISELNQSGYLIIGEPCDLHVHKSRLYMRKLVRKPEQLTKNK